MFENSGTKIKTLAKVLFWVQCIVYTAGDIVLISVLGWYDGYPALLLVLPVLYLLAWLSTIFLAAFGELCEDVHKIAYLQYGGTATMNTSSVNKSVSQQISHSALNDSWVCTCGRRNSTSVKFCGKCGKANPNASGTHSSTWTCPKCGHVNKSPNRICSCGYNK
jgi:hypothetical protein